jgi:hypothetical protein
MCSRKRYGNVMNLFPLVLAANDVTLVIAIIAAIKFRLWSYRSIGLAALAAFMFSLYQFETGRYHPATLVLTAIVVCLITARVFVNFWRYGRK